MTTDENILIEMLDRVTNPAKENVDSFAIQMFYMIVQSNNDLVTKSHKLIVDKIRSTNTAEADRAIGLLEECMAKAGSEFQKKTAKFSFLNELIGLVLDRHDGAPASLETKKRIMDCLLQWTIDHQDKPKIQDAYDNLKKQVDFDHNMTTSTQREHHSTILGKDDQLVAKLLKQGGADNYKKVNLLIQKCVNQEVKRNEFKRELKEVDNTMELLEEMLNSYFPNTSDADTRGIILELYNNCEKYNQHMERWPDFFRDTEPEVMNEFLSTKQLLVAVLDRCKEVFDTPVDADKSTSNTNLLSDLLGDTHTPSNHETQPTKSAPIKDNTALEELNEIFGSLTEYVEINKPPQSLNLLEPITVFNNAIGDRPTTDVFSVAASNGEEEKQTRGFKELREIDKLSEEMFKQSLKEEQRLLSFKKKTEKVTLNDIAKDKIQASLTDVKEADSILKTPVKSSEEKKKINTLDNLTLDFDELKESKEECKEESSNKIEVQENDLKLRNDSNSTIYEGSKTLTSKPLADIFIDLDDVTPLDEGQRLLLDDDIQVTLYFTADRPSEHVSVIVISVINKSKLPVKDFQFEASVKKPCKVRLLPPSDLAMPPKKPFRPSTPINQVMLLLNPTQKPVDIICIIGYRLGDDPDPIKESVVTKDIPYV